MLELHQVRKTYAGPTGAVTALADFSLHVAAGEMVAVRGPSGAGKTTLLLLAGGLLSPDSGRVVVDGRDLFQLSAEALANFRAENIGFVFQQFHLLPYLSVRENVLAANLVRPVGNAGERADELLSRFGLSGRARHVPAALSTGERQRTALARALLHRPRLLLADEPTGNLDDDNGKTVLDYLAEHARQGGTVLLATHDARVAEVAGRTVSLQMARAN